MYCKKCGAENKDDAKYCVVCGEVLVPESKENEVVVAGNPGEPKKVWEVFGRLGYEFGKWSLIFCWTLIFIEISVVGIIFSILAKNKSVNNKEKAEKGLKWSIIATIISFVLTMIISIVVGVVVGIKYAEGFEY
ncbi:MAG: zinc ribbon domain-containing protein [Acholeplasmatales bacterium]|jgi:ABC-type phosphate transport system permease subunit|nr:zinc ribbon domain-containing protein [Acholeplasmatales bacterium]